MKNSLPKNHPVVSKLAPERYHGLDFLRAFAMFLGILLHGSISFTTKPVPFWPVHDTEVSPVVDLSLFTIHSFRMQTFFFLAGFFGCLLYQRYGLRGMLIHRFRRIVIPFVLGVLFIGPSLQILWICGDPNSLKFLTLPVSDQSLSHWERAQNHYLNGTFLKYLHPVHLWFLYYLIIQFAGLALLGWVVPKWLPQSAQNMGDRIFRNVMNLPGRTVILALLLVPALWNMKSWSVDTPGGWIVEGRILAYYSIFVLVGWMVYRHRDLFDTFVNRPWLRLVLAHVFLLPPALFFSVAGLSPESLGDNRVSLDQTTLRLASSLLSALYTWNTVIGLLSLFHRYFSQERSWVRYLADASYWCYIMSLGPLILLQMFVASIEMNGLLKWLVVNGVTLALLLITYKWLVRYTWIGAILNGRKSRKKAELAT